MVQHVDRGAVCQVHLWRAQFREAACRAAKATVPTSPVEGVANQSSSYQPTKHLDIWIFLPKGHLRAFTKGIHWWLISMSSIPRISPVIAPTYARKACRQTCVRNHSWNHLVATSPFAYQHIKILMPQLVHHLTHYINMVSARKRVKPVSKHLKLIDPQKYVQPLPTNFPNPLRNPRSTQASENQNGKPQHNEDDFGSPVKQAAGMAMYGSSSAWEAV